MAGRPLSKSAAARYLGCSRTTVYYLIAEGLLRPLAWGRREKIPLAQLDKLIATGFRAKQRRIS